MTRPRPRHPIRWSREERIGLGALGMLALGGLIALEIVMTMMREGWGG